MPTPPEPLPAPARLPAGSEFARTAPASGSTERSPRQPLTIVLRDLPAPLRADPVGVSVTPLDGPGDYIWLPLSLASPMPNGDLELATSVFGTGEFAATVALDPFAAKASWLARTTARVGTGQDRIVLDAAAVEVTLRPAEGVRHAGPLWLRRRDAAEWQAPGAAAAGVSVRDGKASLLWLGHGDYELCDPLRPERTHAFTIPATTTVELSDALAAPRTGRP